MNEEKRINIKAGDIFDRSVKILEEIMKNDEKYKILLVQKKAGKSVEDLIKLNRKVAKILAKKNNKRIKELKKWQQSGEATRWVEEVEKMRRMNPDLARDDDNRYRRGLKITNEIKKNEEEYEKLLERKNKDEYVDDLIKQNRYTAKALIEQNKKVWDESHYQGLTMKLEVKNAEMQRKLQTSNQLQNMLMKWTKNLQDFMKNEMEYKNLSKREKLGEDVEDLIKQNRIYAEELRRDYIKTHFEANELRRMNPDLFQDPLEKHLFFMAFGLSHDENKKQLKKEKKKKKSQKCPNCSIIMNYLEELDGYQCPKCKKKFYLWEKKLTIMGRI